MLIQIRYDFITYKYKIDYTYIVPNTSVGKSKKQNNLGIFLVILLEELKVHR